MGRAQSLPVEQTYFFTVGSDPTAIAGVTTGEVSVECLAVGAGPARWPSSAGTAGPDRWPGPGRQYPLAAGCERVQPVLGPPGLARARAGPAV